MCLYTNGQNDGLREQPRRAHPLEVLKDPPWILKDGYEKPLLLTQAEEFE